MVTEDKINHRFKYKDLIYGWYKKELYRLPYNKKNIYYSLSKVTIQKDGRYKLGGCKKSLKQLQFLTLKTNKK